VIHKHIPLAIFATLIACQCTAAGEPASDQPPAVHQVPAEQQKQIRQLLLTARTSRSQMPARLRAVKDLIAMGAVGVDALKEHVEREINRVSKLVKAPPATQTLDEQINKHRATLVQLRQDPNLTKEKLQSIGLPALDELTNVYRQREAILDTHRQRYSRTASQIRPLTSLLRQWQAESQTDEALRVPALPLDDYLARAMQILAKATVPPDAEAQRVLEANEEIGRDMPADIMAGLRAMNAMRIMCGASALLIDPKLCEAARLHSADMESKNFFAHESPVPGKTTPWDRAKLAGTTASGENIYMGSNATVDAIKAWFLSPGHHKNMLGESHRRQGLGRSGKYWTQMFGA